MKRSTFLLIGWIAACVADGSRPSGGWKWFTVGLLIQIIGIALALYADHKDGKL